MYWLFPLFIGIFSSFIGSILPGLINTSAVQIAINYGKKQAHIFIFGALMVMFLQTYLALYFARLIDRNPYIADIINEIGLAIFIGLSIYFFSKKKKNNLKRADILDTPKRKRFGYGVLLALLNLFPVLYYVFIGVTFTNMHLFDGSELQRFILSLGVILGAFLAFDFYIYIFRKSNIENHYLIKNINRVLGMITLTIACFNAYKIFK